MSEAERGALTVQRPDRIKVLVEPNVCEGGYRALSRFEGPLVLRFGWSRYAARRSLGWTAFGVMLYGGLAAMAVATEGWPSAIIIMAVGMMSVLFGMYIGIAQALNRTTIAIDEKELRWQHGPLSYEPGGAIAVAQVIDMEMTRADATEDYAHGLVVIDDDDRRHVLIPNQDSFGGDAESINYLLHRLQERLADARASGTMSV